jgi:hypothetical protein
MLLNASMVQLQLQNWLDLTWKFNWWGFWFWVQPPYCHNGQSSPVKSLMLSKSLPSCPPGHFTTKTLLCLLGQEGCQKVEQASSVEAMGSPTAPSGRKNNSFAVGGRELTSSPVPSPHQYGQEDKDQDAGGLGYNRHRPTHRQRQPEATNLESPLTHHPSVNSWPAPQPCRAGSKQPVWLVWRLVETPLQHLEKGLVPCLQRQEAPCHPKGRKVLLYSTGEKTEIQGW